MYSILGSCHFLYKLPIKRACFFIANGSARNIQLIINNYWIRLSTIARIVKAEVCVMCLKPKAEADKTNRGIDNFAIMRKPNPIIVLLYKKLI